MNTDTRQLVEHEHERMSALLVELRHSDEQPALADLVYTVVNVLHTQLVCTNAAFPELRFAQMQRDAFERRTLLADDDELRKLSEHVARFFAALAVRMGDIGEPLHEDEGADEEPLTVPEVWPAPVPEHEPVPA